MKSLKRRYESNVEEGYRFEGIERYEDVWFSVCKKGG